MSGRNLLPVIDTAPRGLRLLTIAETAERLGLSRRAVYRLFEAGDLVRVYPQPAAPRVSEAALDAYIDALHQEAV